MKAFPRFCWRKSLRRRNSDFFAFAAASRESNLPSKSAPNCGGTHAVSRSTIPAVMSKISRTAHRTSLFPESVIREMTRVALSVGAINLSQGYPDFAAPQAIKDAAKSAIDADHNQYSVTWGLKPLRDSIADTVDAGTDPNTAAFRHSLLRDPTDVEVAVGVVRFCVCSHCL